MDQLIQEIITNGANPQATPEQRAAAMMAGTLQAQIQANNQLSQQLLVLQQNVSSMMQSASASTQPAATGSGAPRNVLVDAKTLGKVEKFKGARKEWSDWCFSFKAFLGGADSPAVKAMNWAAAQVEPIT